MSLATLLLLLLGLRRLLQLPLRLLPLLLLEPLLLHLIPLRQRVFIKHGLPATCCCLRFCPGLWRLHLRLGLLPALLLLRRPKDRLPIRLYWRPCLALLSLPLLPAGRRRLPLRRRLVAAVLVALVFVLLGRAVLHLHKRLLRPLARRRGQQFEKLPLLLGPGLRLLLPPRPLPLLGRARIIAAEVARGRVVADENDLRLVRNSGWLGAQMASIAPALPRHCHGPRAALIHRKPWLLLA